MAVQESQLTDGILFCLPGDLLDDGKSVFLGAEETPERARRRVEALAEFWRGQYVIYDELTGNRVSIGTPAEEDRKPTKNFRKAS